MKIGFLVFSLTQSIPYLTYLVSLGYDVFPIILKEDKQISNNKFKAMIEAITNKEIYNDNSDALEKLDALIIIANSDKISFLANIDYNYILKENAPIIFNTYREKDFQELVQIFNKENMYVTNYESTNIVDNCNTIISNMEKVLKKNS